MVDVVYVNHRAQQCGVYEFGREIGTLLETSAKYNIKYVECDSYKEFDQYYKALKPQVVIFNYHAATMPWVWDSRKLSPPKISRLKAVLIGVIHEVFQQEADKANNDLFDFHIAPDPTLLLKNTIVYKTGRLLPRKPVEHEVQNPLPVIGSFGFATPNKGFENIIKAVEREFDEAIIKLNIPFARFGDRDGDNARKLAKQCSDLITKPGIKLEIDHTYLEKDELLKFLSANTLNIFLYEDVQNRGISSTIDWALAAGRPLAISKSTLFRHLFDCIPSICVDDNSLKQIISNGTRLLQKKYKEYSSEVLLWDYERIISDVLPRKNAVLLNRSWINLYKRKLKRKLNILPAQRYNSWVNPSAKAEWAVTNRKLTYTPVDNTIIKYNRILDNEARQLYKPTIDFFQTALPELIARKIPEANVQQAFVFDSAVNLLSKTQGAKILAVGAYEDTAAEALRLLGYDIYFVDPVINYDLGMFITRPDIEAASYDAVISTSVIEHVEDDVTFIKNIACLLKPNGIAILTCDFNDHYKKGDDIPEVDFRLYTQRDLKDRLMSAIPYCKLIDEADWDCPHPDFYLADRYNYTFATLTFSKQA